MKKSIVSAAVLLMFVSFLPFCSKKEASVKEVKGIIVFLSGDVHLFRKGNALPVTLGLAIDAGDRIETGAGSLAVVQITDKNIVRVAEKTVLEMSTIEQNSQVSLFLQKGEIASKITRLEKNGAFTVKTPTTVAAVRGTEFSVAVQDGKEKVAVLSGKVAVGLTKDADQADKKETIADSGNTVVVDTVKKEPAVSVRKIEKDEEATLKKVSEVQLLPELSKTQTGDVDVRKNEISKIEADKNETPAQTKQEKITQLIKEKPKSIEQIKEVFDHIDELSLYSGKTIRGAIISRGTEYSVLTTEGVVKVPADKIRQTNIIK